MKKTSYHLTVRGYELDSFGHVNNAVYLQYAETALWNFYHVSGILGVLEEEGLFPVIMESSQRYMHELHLLDEVRIDTEVTCTGGIVSYKHKIINETTGLVSCKVTGKLVYVNKERIICDIPEALRICIEGGNNDSK
ncbi:acyl-CoA thioester hydrolase [Ruminococcus flavefaciens]|jgi:acyl-CoA thioester hydrolase|uniref:Acyl-CoA thioester hydrolase n=1 Tax=Ruminococcus flavefaciens TaxID=1265 RepID=A0A1H6LK00_RUMFL|nr:MULTISPECIES: thioesterase family protein [Ruminococcus]SEH84953.1 acyl-CoA thioester hydrolase [Ruminococcus flavefaciens]